MAATRFQTWLAELPQGSFKMFFACMAGLLVILAVIFAPIAEALLCWARWHWSPGSLSSIQPDGSRVLAGSCSHLEIPDPALWAIFTFLAAIGGFSSWDFSTKRKTFIPSPPGTPDVEDTKAGVKVPAQPAPARFAFDAVVDAEHRRVLDATQPAPRASIPGFDPANPEHRRAFAEFEALAGGPVVAMAEKYESGAYGEQEGPTILPDNRP